MKKKKISAIALSALIALSCTGGMGVSAENAVKTSAAKEAGTVNKSINTSSEKETDEKVKESFVSSQLEFSLNMFKKSFAAGKGENMLVSPLSAVPALTMAANGADKETLSEMERVLGGELSIEELNRQLSEYLNGLWSGEKCRLHMADSIWIKNVKDLVVNLSFIKTNRDYYDAQIHKAPFNAETVKDINDWVKDNTGGMIKKVINTIDADAVMYLINALAFDAEWNRPYSTDDISDGIFTASDGSRQKAEMMRSEERVYLSDGKAVGFMKPYKGGKYSFAAILPDKNITLEEYVNSLTAEGLQKLLTKYTLGSVDTKTPKFEYDYDIRLDGILKEMGMTSAFDGDKADFSEMGKMKNGNLYIGSVIQKTFIKVDEKGTKAGAATVIAAENAVISVPKVKTQVYLDRPFVYMIVDNENYLPIFMGVLRSL